MSNIWVLHSCCPLIIIFVSVSLCVFPSIGVFNLFMMVTGQSGRRQYFQLVDLK